MCIGPSTAGVARLNDIEHWCPFGRDLLRYELPGIIQEISVRDTKSFGHTSNIVSCFSGLRGYEGNSIRNLSTLHCRVGSSLAEKSTDILVGMDTRTTSPILAHLVISGILGNGGRVHMAGVVPTPTVAFNTRICKAGCMITASHNPEEYNGLKLFNPDGSSFTQSQQREIEAMIGSPAMDQLAGAGELSRRLMPSLPIKMQFLRKSTRDLAKPVIIDCGNGAGSMLTPGLLADAGVKTICINCNPFGNVCQTIRTLTGISWICRGDGEKNRGRVCRCP